MIVTAIYGSEAQKPLAGSSWEFRSVVSDNPTTVHYLSTLYGKAEYTFLDNHTYTGTFFELPISGTWVTYADMLILNQETDKEEVYKFSLTSNNNNLVLHATEKGNSVIIEFVKR
jgi:hypothetical protein